MNVLFCQPSLEYSGSEKSLAEIMGGVREHTTHTPYLLAGGVGPMAHFFESHTAGMWTVNAPKLSRDPARVVPHVRSYWTVYRAMRRIVHETPIDLVHVNTLVFPQATLAARRLGIPVVVHAREVETTYPHWYYRLLVGAATESADRIVCVCDYVRRQPGVPRRFIAKSVVVYNSSGFDTGPIERTVDGPVRALAITPIDRRKGVEDLVPLVEEVRERIGPRDFRLRVLGRICDRALYKDLLAQVGEAGLSDVIEFIDGTDNPAPLYEEAHILIHPSRSEAFPRILVEAANFSLPAVTTNAGGSPEAVIDGETGFVVHVGDIKGMADRIARLASDATLYRDMAARAFARYQAHFTREQMIGALADVWEGLDGNQR